MEDYAKLNLEIFLDRTADRTPTPGGGSVTGAAGAIACALARMVAAYSVRKCTEPTVRSQIEEAAARLRRADQLLRALITQDAVAYAGMTKAAPSRGLQPARTSEDEKRYHDAVLAAVAVPMEMAALASNALSTVDEFKGVASRHLLSDLAIAAVLADATARSARYTVRVNARELDDAPEKTKLLSDMDNIVAHCAGHRDSIETFVRDHLEEAAPPGR